MDAQEQGTVNTGDVMSHSIIAVKGNGPVEQNDDGVVSNPSRA
jgi:hypothetical protein